MTSPVEGIRNYQIAVVFQLWAPRCCVTAMCILRIPTPPNISSFNVLFYAHVHERDKRLPFGYVRSRGIMARHACHKGEEEERMQSGLISLQEAALRRASIICQAAIDTSTTCRSLSRITSTLPPILATTLRIQHGEHVQLQHLASRTF